MNARPSVLLILLLIGFPQISETIYTPALPSIADALGVPNYQVQWTLSIYFAGFAIGVLLWGRLSDRLGRRPAMLLGLFVYAMGSAACLVPWGIEWMLAMRFVQAAGASAGSVVTQTMIRECWQGQERAKLFAVIGMAISLTPALGPFIGGYLNEFFGWQSNFAVLVFIGGWILFQSLLSLPETKPAKFATAIESLPKVLWRMLKDPHVMACAWAIGAMNGLLFSYYAEAPFVFIDNLHLTPSQYGWLGIVVSLSSLSGFFLSHRLIGRLSARTIVLLGNGILISSALVLLLGVSWLELSRLPTWLAVVCIMLPYAGIILGGMSFVNPVMLSHALQDYHELLGTAGALLGFIYYLYVALLTWLMGYLHDGSLVRMPQYFLVLAISVALASSRANYD